MKRVIFLIIALVVFSITVNGQYIRFTKAYGKKYVYLKDVAKYYGMHIVTTQKGCELRSRYSALGVTFQKRGARFNGMKINLLNAPFLKKGQPMISEVDFLSFLEPLLRKKALTHGKVKTIMIDPGHGGKDSGAKGKRYKEKDIVLKISQKLRYFLEAKGYKVILTRSDDRFPTLLDRTEMCSKYNPDLFLSIHCNAAGAKSANGIETFCMTPAGSASTTDIKPSYKKEKGNAFNKNSARLAVEVQKQLLKETNAHDRGVKHARFFVLKKGSSPGVLIEAGFLSNYPEESKLGSSAYQTKIAKAIANAVIIYTKAVK